jgi:DNA-binding CsgD family transcriptional regulator
MAVQVQGFADPGLFRFMGEEIEALVELRELDLADALLGRLEERGAALARPWALGVAARGRALLAGADGESEDALSRADEAVEHHAMVGMPFELGRSLLVQGKLRRRSRQKRAARESLDAARSLFERLPAPLWAAAAANELRRISGRPPGRAALTPTEERVASLAAEGRTDREIAAALFISTRTASAHLTRIYRKLGVRSRTELAAGVRDGPLVSERHDAP